MSIYFDSKTGERETNQDSHNIIQNIKIDQDNVVECNLFAIYDGHGDEDGGDFVSKFLSEYLPKFLVNEKTKLPLNKKYVNKVYDKLQQILEKKYSKESHEVGSTCLVTLLYTLKEVVNGKELKRKYINVLNTGDSRMVLCRDYIGNNITKDHKPDMLLERSRIVRAGGASRISYTKVCRIDDLSVSRAFGDNVSKKYVTHRPDLFIKEINKKRDSFMILACDGLWDVFNADDACNFVLNKCYDLDLNRVNKTSMNIASELCKEAIKKDCGDNVSVIVVFFN
jgi:serine/threonine protein phosphatase PrpC